MKTISNIQSSDEINESDEFDSSIGQQILEVFSGSCDPSNFVSNYPILSKLSYQSQKCHIDSVTRKCQERDDNIKSSDSSSDEETEDSNILCCVLVKLRRKGKCNIRQLL